MLCWLQCSSCMMACMLLVTIPQLHGTVSWTAAVLTPLATGLCISGVLWCGNTHLVHYCFSSDPSHCLNSLMSFLYPSTSSALLLSRLSYQDSSFSVTQFFSCLALNALKCSSTYADLLPEECSFAPKNSKEGLSAIETLAQGQRNPPLEFLNTKKTLNIVLNIR